MDVVVGWETEGDGLRGLMFAFEVRVLFCKDFRLPAVI